MGERNAAQVVKRFIHTGRAYYAARELAREKYVDEVIFGLYAPEGGSHGEMQICWYPWSALSIMPMLPRLECYDDGWAVLAQLRDVLDEMATVGDQDITPEAFCTLLERCGFEDATPVKRG